MFYHIRLSDQAETDLSVLDSKVVKRITKKLKEFRASLEPMYFAKPLQGIYKGLYRFRIGDYRVIFRKDIDGTLIILFILRVQHRKDVYE